MNTDHDGGWKDRHIPKKRPDIMAIAAAAFLAVVLLVFIFDGAALQNDVSELPAEYSSAYESSRETFSASLISAPVSTTRKVTAVSSATSEKAVPAVVSVTSKVTSASKAPAETTAPATSAVKKTSAPATSQTTAAVSQTSVTVPETETETAPPETSVSETAASSDVSTTVPETSVTTVTTTTVPAVSFPADINKLTYDEFLTIPGIGEKMAGDIVYLRERLGVITDMELLLELYGIGEEKLAQLKAYLFVSDSDYRPVTQTTTSETTTTVTETEPPPPERKPVNINTAGENELAESLLISGEKAAEIVSVRELIGGFTSPDELRLVTVLTESDLKAISAYIIL